MLRHRVKTKQIVVKTIDSMIQYHQSFSGKIPIKYSTTFTNNGVRANNTHYILYTLLSLLQPMWLTGQMVIAGIFSGIMLKDFVNLIF